MYNTDKLYLFVIDFISKYIAEKNEFSWNLYICLQDYLAKLIFL